ncbi:hypothetical protein FRC14_000142 [Serendipita sp. 396]|nr:hypothetical protein FRC14_000142 [Serendipita sp. 396]
MVLFLTLLANGSRRHSRLPIRPVPPLHVAQSKLQSAPLQMQSDIRPRYRKNDKYETGIVPTVPGFPSPSRPSSPMIIPASKPGGRALSFAHSLVGGKRLDHPVIQDEGAFTFVTF